MLINVLPDSHEFGRHVAPSLTRGGVVYDTIPARKKKRTVYLATSLPLKHLLRDRSEVNVRELGDIYGQHCALTSQFHFLVVVGMYCHLID